MTDEEHRPARVLPRRRVLFAGCVGNLLEWYDFSIYGYLAPVIAAQFFPSDNKITSLIATFGAFAAGFLMRPIGGALLGHIGDRYGRKRLLIVSVVLMGIPTSLIGLLPTHASIGVAAAVLLVLLRLLQGLSVGGEYTGSIVYLMECAPPNRRALYASVALSGGLVGTLLGSGISALVSEVLSDEAFREWGWRVPFIIGIVIAAIGFYIRRGIPELPIRERTSSPLIVAFRSYWAGVLRVMGMFALTAIGFYSIFVFVVSWLIEFVHESRSVALWITTVNIAAVGVILPTVAALSDRVGGRWFYWAGALGILFFAYPLVWMMHHDSVVLIFLGQFAFAALISLYGGAVTPKLIPMFPASVRVTAVSVGYNLTYAILGGTTPIIAVWLIGRAHDDLAFAWYISAAALVTCLVLLTVKETRRRRLTD